MCLCLAVLAALWVATVYCLHGPQASIPYARRYDYYHCDCFFPQCSRQIDYETSQKDMMSSHLAMRDNRPEEKYCQKLPFNEWLIIIHNSCSFSWGCSVTISEWRQYRSLKIVQCIAMHSPFCCHCHFIHHESNVLLGCTTLCVSLFPLLCSMLDLLESTETTGKKSSKLVLTGRGKVWEE